MMLHAATWENTLFDGKPWPEDDIDILWHRAWIDLGPSPAGNQGPYLKVPAYWPQRELMQVMFHRIYLKPKFSKVIKINEFPYYGNHPARWVFETNRKGPRK